MGSLPVVIVHWNQPRRCLGVLSRLREQGVAIRPIVVDNGSRAAQLAELRAGLAGEAELIELGANTGFGPAANAGLRAWLGEGGEEWAALMPHDALPQPGALAALLEMAGSRPRLGLLSADVGDGSTPLVHPYLGGVTKPAASSSGFEAADHPHGTLMLVRRGCAEEIGLFDERYFAYCEEADLGLRAAVAGWEVGLARGVMVVNPHMGPGSPAVDYLQLRNTLLLLREHWGPRQVGFRLLVALYQLARGLASRARRPELFDARARLLALRDFGRGSFGPPPRSLAVK